MEQLSAFCELRNPSSLQYICVRNLGVDCGAMACRRLAQCPLNREGEGQPGAGEEKAR